MLSVARGSGCFHKTGHGSWGRLRAQLALQDVEAILQLVPAVKQWSTGTT